MILAWSNGAQWRETQETYFVRVASEAEADEVEALARPLMERSFRVGLFQEVAPMKVDLVKTPEEFLRAVWTWHNPSCPDYSDGDDLACTCERAAAMQWIARRSGARGAAT